MAETQTPSLVDLHQDWSGMRAETGYPGFAHRDKSLGTKLPVIGELDELKPISSDVEGLREGRVGLIFANMWPLPGNKDLSAEFRGQKDFYDAIVDERPDRLMVVDSTASLEMCQGDPSKTGFLYTVEGLPGWDKDLGVLEQFWQRGVRGFGPVHNDDNNAGTGHGSRERHGLTPKGKELVREANRMGFILDLSHASRRTARDILANADRVIVTHTGSRDLYRQKTGRELSRNLDDNLALEVVRRGGIVGVSLVGWQSAERGKATIEDVVDQFDHYRELFSRSGVQNPTNYLAIGSDFNGMLSSSTVPGLDSIDTLGHNLSEALRAREFSMIEIENVLARSAMNYLGKPGILPDH